MRVLGLLVLAAVSVPALCSELAQGSAPLLMWSSTAALGSGARVDYEVVPDVASVVGQVVAAAVGKGSSDGGFVASPQQLQTVVVFIGSGQLSTLDLRSTSRVTKLADVLDRAASSVSLPYTSFDGMCLHDAVETQLKAAGVAFESVSCKQAVDNLSGAITKLVDAQAQQTSPRVLVISAHVDSALVGTTEGLSAELDQMLTVSETLEALEQEVLFVYTTRPAKTAARRALQSAPSTTYKGFGQYQECGQLCRVQVRWLEAILAILVLALASCSGLTCLYMLDGPTKFEVSKDAMQATS